MIHPAWIHHYHQYILSSTFFVFALSTEVLLLILDVSNKLSLLKEQSCDKSKHAAVSLFIYLYKEALEYVRFIFILFYNYFN